MSMKIAKRTKRKENMRNGKEGMGKKLRKEGRKEEREALADYL